MIMKRQLSSIVTPCYNEQDNVVDCYEAVRCVCEQHLAEFDYEHIFCDNASRDGTVDRLKLLAGKDSRVKIIINSRNFGPFCSTFNGVMSTQGDGVVVMLAADLQDPPELIPQFVRSWVNGYQVVYGVRKVREENIIMHGIRRLYYWLVSKFADISIPLNVGEFQLVDRVVIEALRKFDDYYPYIRGMIANCGFRTTGIEYTWKARKKGFSKNRLYHLIDQGLNGFVSFSRVPMRLCLLSGFLVSALSILFAACSLAVNLIHFGQLTAPGIPTLIVALFFFSGVQLFFFGVLGEYISAVHCQVRKRPLVIEKERINFGPQPSSSPSNGSHSPGALAA
jgi:glycosyltransferase involved in cell wall biosynthesis